jgi:hypothetical protein
MAHIIEQSEIENHLSFVKELSSDICSTTERGGRRMELVCDLTTGERFFRITVGRNPVKNTFRFELNETKEVAEYYSKL